MSRSEVFDLVDRQQTGEFTDREVTTFETAKQFISGATLLLFLDPVQTSINCAITGFPPKTMNNPNHVAQYLYLLFPATYLIHVVEEYFGGSSEVRANARVDGTNVSPFQFVFFNGFGIALMMVGFFIGRNDGFLGFISAMLGMVVFVNGLSHTYATISRRKYNPGFVSGILLWVPLGLVMLTRGIHQMSLVRYAIALGSGVGVQIIVSLISANGDSLWGSGAGLGSVDDIESAPEG